MRISVLRNIFRNLRPKIDEMNIEIITIGDELLIGQVVDTNSAWMAEKLSEAGFVVNQITSIKDNHHSIFTAIDDGFKRSDILLLTGGNGPTKDDITKNTLCNYFDDHLIMNDEVVKNIEALFQQKKLVLNELTRNQALVPKKSKVIQNKVGTAPILWFEKNGKVLVSMPGVPFEMRYAMNEEIIPRLTAAFETKTFLKQVFFTYGISESALAIHLNEFEGNLPDGFALAYLPGGGVIRLRLSVKGEEHSDEMKKQAENLKNELGEYLLIDSEGPLEQILATTLKNKGLTISLAESCSGGYIAHLLTTIPGSSSYFKGGIVSYADSSKKKLLYVKEANLEKYGAVSEQVVEEMAKGALSIFETDCAIAVSGIAGPDGGTDVIPVGTVWICTIYKDIVVSNKYRFGNSREENINRSATMAMVQMLRMIK
ncbi:MAG: CinA family nicotinamide mononucleotide deamidase-related protein [Dysgonamonadaceae bacterium]|jgi:nicotinamide-nucleotide amidase|nr:CinA family nicotinamide mononucleotide deamidase-related protein [Dysgonamonadaceae bacterium]MDD3355887.1 CinA family nicotinamide mononucleotide deamidase-related protein [Dysgonamonadaceae bacterium]MDD3728150.1 CinA family nicotinamide mononucleotide deamidase-related protein [Dysgonamonadaceae bacterium]MDD4246176.1 CinA family nicotinamide mononucleotide deamidase-related protein [Dysgonamonadaceae bacterium]MDD4605130.1 CinA family nicotinamide mononucleotide deamidase-related protei